MTKHKSTITCTIDMKLRTIYHNKRTNESTQAFSNLLYASL